MGKPYSTELKQLEDTYAAAISLNIDHLCTAVAASASLPLLAVGSGGSLTAAHFMSTLHQRFAGKIAKVVTPLELIVAAPVTREIAVWCLSAGGSNPDIKAAFQTAVLREPKQLFAICTKTGSPLSHLVSKHHYTGIFEFDLPSQKDGFLATNSLLAFFVLLARAYHRVFTVDNELPESLSGLIYQGSTADEFKMRIEQKCFPLWERRSLTLLYSIPTQSAAVDIESKFVEAALGDVQHSDYRNFAHGRHYWLAKRGNDTAVLSLGSDSERELIQATLQLLPPDIPVVKLHFTGGDTAVAIKSLVACLYVVGSAGKQRGIDPGRPGVPLFGQRLYHLRALGTPSIIFGGTVDACETAIIRKTGTLPNVLAAQGQLEFWYNAYQDFIQKLQSVSFSTVVFDYDGTLCDERDRFGSPEKNIAKEISRLLRAGIIIGIATGRGKSVKKALREIIPNRYWKHVIVGCYNGADCGLLSDDNHPNTMEKPCHELGVLAKVFQSNLKLVQLADLTVRSKQITVEPKQVLWSETVISLINQIVYETNSSGARLVTSSRSIDVLGPGVSKRTVVEKARELSGEILNPQALCIGDRGKWPGNDFDLLSELFSLSVDETSSDSETCWNLAPAGYRGAQATLGYLRSLQVKDDGLHFDLTQIR
ncbi:HAD hydrolase family protein [Synechococcus sp. PCC 6312]|uniref:HAD hydrolase family protein n=1 Tax=Synechococcus sp. (strain ATCC 27167 / PCC 6312) TaxID=195253 RepID=UPI00029F2601|nr:HAD hydrolase family protein [Synechococcus sp. PCC 6312]AFY61886.1 putative HAD superfamily hydrolase [Synechococcus sp. PCC 6312]